MSSRTKQTKQQKQQQQQQQQTKLQQQTSEGGGPSLFDLMTGPPPPEPHQQQQPPPDASGDTTEVSTDEYDALSPELPMSQLQQPPAQQRFTRGRSLTGGRSLTDDWNDNAISPQQPPTPQPKLEPPPTPKAVRGRRTLSGVNAPAALVEHDFRVVKVEQEAVKVEQEAVKVEPEAVKVESPAVKVEPEAVKVESPAVKVESPAVKVEQEQEPSGVKREPSGVKREPSGVKRERDERPQPDAMPPLKKKIPNLPNYMGLFDEVNDIPLAEMGLAGYTPAAGRILKAKWFMSLFTAKPLGLSSSAYSGLKGADEVWHDFIERHPEVYEAFGRSLGYEGGIPHTPGSGSVADVVDIEDRFIRKYKRIFREMPTIPEPEQELPEKYAEQWEQNDEFVCG